MTDQATNFERLSRTMHLLQQTLAPFVERELKRTGAGWWTNYVLPGVAPLTRERLPAMPKRGVTGQLEAVPVEDLLALIAKNFASAFRGRLKDPARSYAEELRGHRNLWAHKAAGDIDRASAERAMDTAALLLDDVDPSAARAVRAIKVEGEATAPVEPAPASGGRPSMAPLLEVQALEPPSAPRARTAMAAAPGAVAPSFMDTGLAPWRDVVIPRPDVRSGALTRSQFAADLHEVHRGTPGVGTDYTDPREFFERTYVTAGIREFLKTALRRLTDQGGDPVVQLKTGFGGGKTHTMLALYHMARSGADILNDVPVLKELSAELGAPLPRANVAVLVGTKISATAPYDDDPEVKALGISLKTLWGHMAWQLGGWKAYQVVQTADDRGVAPGEELRKVLGMAAPCVIVIDELVAYGRNLPTRSGQVPGGSLASLLTFLQALTEMVRVTPGVFLAASIPESDMEIGGVQGEQVLAKIQQTFGRMEVAFQPVQATESFEVVRRRLFERVDAGGRDQTVAAFVKYYRDNSQDFPDEVREKAYEERMKSAYPFHPELFDRLYEDWNGAVAHFQSTRGVLRLLAGAVQAMWLEQDSSALIMPATIRLDLPVVRDELMRYLPPQFQSVIDSDIEGPSSEAWQIDASNPRFTRIAAARAAARTILLGSVPGKGTPGIEDVRIRLGAARPGEAVATYNDVLGRLRERLQFLHGGASRYWFEVRPNLNKTVADRISRITTDDAVALPESRLKADGERGPFAGKYVAPVNSADVPDEMAVRLVVISPRFPFKDREPQDPPAVVWLKDVLDHRGNAPRLHRNMLVFAAFDENAHEDLMNSAKSYLAWKSIVDEKRQLNLDENQVKQATEQRDNALHSVDAQLARGYHWAIVPQQRPVQANGKWTIGEETLDAVNTDGQLSSMGALAPRMAAALQSKGQLVGAWSPIFLTQELERWFWSQGLEHVSAKRLWEENFSRYVYLPRLGNRDVFMKAVQDGAAGQEFFGYALGIEGKKYLGLSFGQRPQTVLLDDSAVIVRKDVAAAAVAMPGTGAQEAEGQGPVATGQGAGSTSEASGGPAAAPRTKVMRRFYGSVKLNQLKVSSSAGQIADEVVKHLAGLVDAEVEVVLEVRATVPGGFPDTVVRTVSENARTLKFQAFEFEED